jgi:hypothetical protein
MYWPGTVQFNTIPDTRRANARLPGKAPWLAGPAEDLEHSGLSVEIWAKGTFVNMTSLMIPYRCVRLVEFVIKNQQSPDL